MKSTDHPESPKETCAVRSLAGLLAAWLGVLLLPTQTAQAAEGFGYMVTGAPAEAQVIDPVGGNRVLVAWIDNSDTSKSVQVGSFDDGRADESSRREIFTSDRNIWSLKLESTPDRQRLLCVNDGVTSNYHTRILRFNEEFQELERISWFSDTNVLPTGRMLGGDGKLLLSRSLNSAYGRFVDASSLSAQPWFFIQLERDRDWLEESYYDLPRQYYPYKYDDWVKLPPRLVTGCDTAISPDGTSTAVYDFKGIHLRRFRPNGTVMKNMVVDGRPYSGFPKLAKTAVAVLEDQSTLMAWEWHDYYFVGAQIMLRSADPFFRGLLADGSETPTIQLLPASTTPDIQDTPAVGLRPDGTGAVAWTVRTAEGSTVWLQRLDAGMQAFEAARRVDARPGFDTDKPMVRGDDEGNLFLSWRCTSTADGPSEIGILNLAVLDQLPASPQILHDGSTIQIHWTSPPASQLTLWYSPTLCPEDAVAICSETAISGPRVISHQPGSPKGFYWLSTE